MVRMQIRHFRHFRQKPPLFWRDKSTVYQKHRFRDPDTCKHDFHGIVPGFGGNLVYVFFLPYEE